MKLTGLALASVFALTSTLALANTVHHKQFVRADQREAGMVHLHPNYGNPGGPATFSGTGKDYAVPGWTDEQTRYWLDSASGPKG